MINLLLIPENRIEKEENDGQKEPNRHNDCEGDSSNSIVGALVTDIPEACGVPFAADGAIWTKEDRANIVGEKQLT